MEVSGELYIAAALARERIPVPSEWAHEQAGRFEEEGISFPYRFSNPDRPSCSLVAILNTP